MRTATTTAGTVSTGIERRLLSGTRRRSASKADSEREPSGVMSPCSEQVSHVVVIGGSLSGLFAAAAVSGGGREVVVVERDVFPSHAQPRSGVPQSRHTHGLLYRGLQAAEQLLPGFRDDLVAAGAVPVNGGHVLWLSALGWLPRTEGFEVVSATRPLLEQVVRERTFALPGVSARQGSRVSGLQRAGERWLVQLDNGDCLETDFVIDASGRSSRLPVWLAELGVRVPQPSRLDAQVGYATRYYRSTSPDFPGCAGIVVAATPEAPRGALVFPAEDNHWLVTVVGFGEDRPPRDNDGFREFLRRLPDAAISDVAAGCEPVGDVSVHRQTANVRHRYEKVRAWPPGLLAVGDALCAFDPVYGQGVTVGAIQALTLRQAAERGLVARHSRRLQRKVAASVKLPWSIATGADTAFATSEARLSKLQQALGVWSEELTRLVIHGNSRANDAMSRVYNLMGSPALLLHPALVLAAARARLRGYPPPPPRPEVLEQLGRSQARVS